MTRNELIQSLASSIEESAEYYVARDEGLLESYANAIASLSGEPDGGELDLVADFIVELHGKNDGGMDDESAAFESEFGFDPFA